jgi:hypothetical protein
MLCDRAGLRYSGAANDVTTIAKSRTMREPTIASV